MNSLKFIQNTLEIQAGYGTTECNNCKLASRSLVCTILTCILLQAGLTHL